MYKCLYLPTFGYPLITSTGTVCRSREAKKPNQKAITDMDIDASIRTEMINLVTSCDQIPPVVVIALVAMCKEKDISPEDRTRIYSIYSLFMSRKHGIYFSEDQITSLLRLCEGLVVTETEINLRACDAVLEDVKAQVIEIIQRVGCQINPPKRTKRIIDMLDSRLKKKDFMEVRSLCDKLCSKATPSFSQLLDDSEFYFISWDDKNTLRLISKKSNTLEHWQLKQLQTLEECVVSGEYDIKELEELIECVCKFPVPVDIVKPTTVPGKYKRAVTIASQMGVFKDIISPLMPREVPYKKQEVVDAACERLHKEISDRKDRMKTVGNSHLPNYERFILTTAVASYEDNPSIRLNTDTAILVLEKYKRVPWNMADVRDEFDALIRDISRYLVDNKVMQQGEMRRQQLGSLGKIVLGYTLLALMFLFFVPLDTIIGALLFSLPVIICSFYLNDETGGSIVTIPSTMTLVASTGILVFANVIGILPLYLLLVCNLLFGVISSIYVLSKI